ncbi:MAG TPA: septum formation initiator family protein [Candidatus Acidoferrales bacterium]|nr:septum formation initiator family protein [Candidatus Acidoferrales bacterium]
MTEPAMSFAEQLREFLRRNATWFLAAAFSLLLLQDVFGTHGVLAMRRAQKEAATVKQEINLINDENRQLQDRVKALKTDPQAIEHIAREDLGLARPGEFIFKTSPRSADASKPVPQPAEPPKNP